VQVKYEVSALGFRVGWSSAHNNERTTNEWYQSILQDDLHTSKLAAFLCYEQTSFWLNVPHEHFN